MTARIHHFPHPGRLPSRTGQCSSRTKDAARPAPPPSGVGHLSPARNARNVTAPNGDEPCLFHCANEASREAGRATYISRTGLIAAICASWAIAVVAGVALIGALT